MIEHVDSLFLQHWWAKLVHLLMSNKKVNKHIYITKSIPQENLNTHLENITF